MSSKLILFIFAFATIAAATFIARREQQKVRLVEQQELNRSISSLSVDLKYAPIAGLRYVYRMRREISFNGRDIQIPDIRYEGELYIDVVKANEVGFEAIVSDALPALPQEKPANLLLKMDRTGKKLVLFSSGEALGEREEQHINILRDAVANWAFLNAKDTVGAYEAEFSSDKLGFSKRKVAYLKKQRSTPKIVQSKHRLDWDEKISFPLKVAGVEELLLGENDSGIRTKSKYEMSFDRSMKLASIPSSAHLNSIADTTIAASGPRGDYGKKIEWSEISRQLAGIGALKPGERLKVFGDLVKFLRAMPAGSSLSNLIGMLTSEQIAAGPNSPLYMAIVGALATAASPDMQKALVALYQDASATVDGKGTILAALTTTQAQLDEDTRSFLAATMASSNRSLADGAAFALGSALQNTGDGGAAGIAAIKSAWNAANGNLSSQLSLLDAMGNSGRSEFLPILEASIQSNESPVVRAKAEFALRSISTSAATDSLVAGLSDADPQVRAAAASAIALAAWQEAFRAPLKQCSSQDSLPGIRESCAATLSRYSTVASTN